MLRSLLLAVFVVAALGGEPQFELSGRFTPEGRASVSLYGVASPFVATALSEDGHFSFKKLEPGAYTIAVFIPGRGEARQTVEGIPVGLEGGIGISYPFLPNLVGRVNFLAAYQLFSSPLGLNLGFFPPSAGLEVAYYPAPNWEVTVGYNGNGDVIGLRWHL